MNQIELAKLYLANLQKRWKRDSLTAILENQDLVRTFQGAEANEIKLPVMEMDGLGDYSKSGGYPDGSVNLSWETRKLTQDRGRKFTLDSMDNFESMGVVGGNLMAEFQRTKVAPEVDAYRFAKIAQKARSGNRAYGTISSDAGAEAAFDAACLAFDDAEVPKEGRILFCLPAFYKHLKKAVGANRMYTNHDKNIDRDIDYIDGVRIVETIPGRFYVGFQKTNNGFINEGARINFILIHQDAMIPVVKHNPIRIFDPSVNQNADGWIFNYRLYHDIFDRPLKDIGIYLHTIESYVTETVDTPVITVEDDKTASVKFTVATPTTGASLYYTTDGTDPTSASSAYSSKVTLTDDSIAAPATSEVTIKVIGIKDGMLSSEVASQKVTVVGSKT